MTPTVMIADDSLLIRAVVIAGLEAEGYEVMQAEDGTAALEQCQLSPPDVILLDIVMPGLDGYQVLAKLKADPNLSHIPVVFLTGRTGMADVVAGLRAGAHDYLKKPFEPEELLARVGSAIHVKQLQDKLLERNAALDKVSRTDALTGLFNRRHLDEELTLRHAEARRHHEPLGLGLLDIDHFKKINDRYGHLTGDDVLRGVADVLRAQSRDGKDLICRFGGEEFAVFLPGVGAAEVPRAAERLRRGVADLVTVVDGVIVQVTASVGVTVADPVEAASASVSELLATADLGLYRAKAEGRDQVQLHGQPDRRTRRI